MDKLARLMAPDPQFIEPLLLAEGQEYLSGELKLSDMQRLRDLLADTTGKVQYQLRFGKDSQGVICILGEFRTTLQVICQRCLNPVPVEIERDICAGIVADKAEESKLQARYEPLMLSDGQLSLSGFIEEEILLGMPMAAAHQIDQCPAVSIMNELKPVKDSPFRVLKDLKLKNSKS